MTFSSRVVLPVPDLAMKEMALLLMRTPIETMVGANLVFALVEIVEKIGRTQGFEPTVGPWPDQ
jgi:hypothetical protein